MPPTRHYSKHGHHYKNKIATTACKQAEAFSLRCLHKQGNLNSLRAHNRPAVLTLINQQGEPRYVTITSIQNGLATVFSNNNEYTITLGELDKYWYGQFILLWHKPTNYYSAITPGDNGDIIKWLETHYTKTQTTNSHQTYDHNLIKKVKTFQ